MDLYQKLGERLCFFICHLSIILSYKYAISKYHTLDKKTYVSTGSSPREENGLGEVYETNRMELEQQNPNFRPVEFLSKYIYLTKPLFFLYFRRVKKTKYKCSKTIPKLTL